MSSMNIHDIYNFSLINHNEILKKKICRVETNIAYTKRKYYYKQFQSALFCLKKIFIFKIIFVVERFITHNAHHRRHIIVILKHCNKKLLKL